MIKSDRMDVYMLKKVKWFGLSERTNLRKQKEAKKKKIVMEKIKDNKLFLGQVLQLWPFTIVLS